MTDNKKVPPKGGSKGGTRYPRISLKKAHEYSTKLVSKTHTGAQPEGVILPGVFGNAGPDGKVRASALKQYNLLDGTPKAYIASELAQKLNGSTPEDLQNYLKEAFLTPKLFKTLFDTFCNDSITRARIRQQASNLKVHPESLDDCVQVYVESAVYSGLATENSDSVEFHATPVLTTAESELESDSDLDEGEIAAGGENNSTTGEGNESTNLSPSNDVASSNLTTSNSKPKSNIDIKIDPSMDPEKLDKLLAVLQKYGQL